MTKEVRFIFNNPAVSEAGPSLIKLGETLGVEAEVDVVNSPNEVSFDVPEGVGGEQIKDIISAFLKKNKNVRKAFIGEEEIKL